MSLTDVIEGYTTGLYRVDRAPVADVVDGHAVPFVPLDQVASGVDDVADTIALPAHGLATGYGPVWVAAATPPAPLDALTPYWVIAADADHVKLALTRADALSLVAVDLLDDGVGVVSVASHFFVRASVQDDGAALDDAPEGERLKSTNTIWLLTRLYASGGDYEPDIIHLSDGRYRVENVAFFGILSSHYRVTVERLEIP